MSGDPRRPVEISAPCEAVSVPWTRAELVAVREAIELTPLFEGRSEARDSVRAALRSHRIVPTALDGPIALRLATRIVPVDLTTATARAKLERAVRGLRAALTA